jgi:uncharacterized protein DUF5719
MRRLWIGVAAAVLLAGAGLADRFRPAHAPLPRPVEATSPGGVWACPIVKLAGSPGWLHLVNSGERSSSVRVSYIVEGKAPVEQAFALSAGRARTLAVPRGLTPFGAGAIVEYAGGNVTISRTMQTGGVTGAATCARPGAGTLVLPQGSTLKTETALVLLNPGGADAVVDVSLSVDGRVIQPESLRGRVVPARKRLVVREGDFAFDTRVVGATVTASSGRVVVDGLLQGSGAIDLITAVPAVREIAAIASSARGPALFSALAIGEDDAATDSHVVTSQGRTTFGPLVTALAPDTPVLASAGADAPGAVALHIASSTAPIAIGARWQVKARNGASDYAAAAGVVPAHEIVAVLGPPTVPSAMRLLIANPDDVDASVDVAVVTETGTTEPADLQHVVVAAGRTVTLPVRGVAANATVGLVLRSSGGQMVAAIEATTPTPAFGAYAVTGSPFVVSPPVAVRPDPRQGVPAP